MGRGPAVVERQRRNVGALVSGRRPVARRRRKSAAPESDGTGDDVFHSTEFFLFRRSFRRLVDRLDLVQHRAGHSRKEKSFGTENVQRSSGRVEKRAPALAEFSSTR